MSNRLDPLGRSRTGSWQVRDRIAVVDATVDRLLDVLLRDHPAALPRQNVARQSGARRIDRRAWKRLCNVILDSQ